MNEMFSIWLQGRNTWLLCDILRVTLIHYEREHSEDRLTDEVDHEWRVVDAVYFKDVCVLIIHPIEPSEKRK